jgi:dolichyl-phosphate-mannose-protein mannosyltransferase
MREFLSRHRGMLALLALAVLVRAGVAIAHRPALFFSDSFIYLWLRDGDGVVGFAPDRPSGYPLLLDVLARVHGDLLFTTLVQHLAGLLGGTLVYALLLRLSVDRRLALFGAAIVLLDGYAIALEQFIMPESFFATALIASAYLAIRRTNPAALACSGLLLGAAVTIRTAAIFAVPVWIIYVVWSRPGWRPALAAAGGFLLPVLAVAAMASHAVGHFGLSRASGWFLYARIAEIGDCGRADIPAAARPLCNRTASDRRGRVAYHMWDRHAPSQRLFGRDGVWSGWPGPRQERSNRILKGFAQAIIRDRPLRYAQMVAADFLRYFQPGVASIGRSDAAIHLPARETPIPRGEPFTRVQPVHAPAKLVRAYQGIVHTPRWLLAPLALAGLIVIVLTFAGRLGQRLPRRREVFLLSGAGLAMLLGSALTNEFILRYLIPTVPLLVGGGILAIVDLVALRRRSPAPSAAPS